MKKNLKNKKSLNIAMLGHQIKVKKLLFTRDIQWYVGQISLFLQ